MRKTQRPYRIVEIKQFAKLFTVGGLGGDLRAGAVGTVTSLIPVYTLLFVLSSEPGRGRMVSALAPVWELLFSVLQVVQLVAGSVNTGEPCPCVSSPCVSYVLLHSFPFNSKN